MSTALTQVGLFLVNLVFGFLINMVLLRFFLQLTKADFHNPIIQFIVKITHPLLRPFRKIIPGLLGMDLASIVLALALQLIEILLLGTIQSYTIGTWVFLTSVITLVSSTLNIFFFAIIIRAIMSWINPSPYHPLAIILNQLTDLVLRPIQRYLPPIAGIDLSPLVALVLIQIISIFMRSTLGV